MIRRTKAVRRTTARTAGKRALMGKHLHMTPVALLRANARLYCATYVSKKS